MCQIKQLRIICQNKVSKTRDENLIREKWYKKSEKVMRDKIQKLKNFEKEMVE